MRRLWIPVLGGVLAVAGVGAAQSMIESATAAAGGSAAAVAGKSVSEGIDKVMSRVGDITKQAAGVGDGKAPKGRAFPARPEVPRAKPAIALPAQEIKVRKMRQQSKSTGYAATLKPTVVNASAPPVLAGGGTDGTATPPPVVAAPPPDLQTLQSGSPRAEVVGQMGTPLSKVTMADDSGLVEIYRWRQGTVRMVNGIVSEVTPAQQ